MMIDTKEKIIQKFNAELGSDLKGLNKIYEFHRSLATQKNEIKKSVRTFKHIQLQFKLYYKVYCKI